MLMPFKIPNSDHRLGLAPSVVASFVWLVLGAFLGESKAESCGVKVQSTIATDRPQVTNSSVVVPCGGLQFENGFQVTGREGKRTLDYPETSARLGVAAKTELRFSAPNRLVNDLSASGKWGFGDLSLGLKQHLGPHAKFDVSLISAISFPTGASSISSHGYDPTVQLPWSRALSKTWTVAGQFGIAWPTTSGRHNVAGQASTYFDRQITSRWDAYVEYSGVFQQHSGPQHLVDFGVTYRPTSQQQLDFHDGFGLPSADANYLIGFGYSVYFQMFRAK